MSNRPATHLLKPFFLCMLAAPCCAQGGQDQELRHEVAELRALAQSLQARIDGLEKRLPAPTPENPVAAPPSTTPADWDHNDLK